MVMSNGALLMGGVHKCNMLVSWPKFTDVQNFV